MRVNEATALYWEDVDFEKKTLAINHNLQYINRENWVRRNKLKTESSRRTIGLDDNTLNVLREGKNRQVRRMTAKAGFPCLRLVRVAIGRLNVFDLGLGLGQWAFAPHKP